MSGKIRGAYRRTDRFFSTQIWQQRLDELSSNRARLYRAARILDCTVRGLLFGDTLHVRSAALTYFTILSLVPLLAFAFALLKGFGAYQLLVEDQVRPYVLDQLSGNEALRSAFEHILGFVAQTDVTSLGFLGLLTLLYASTRLLANIEGALNEIWGITSGRDLFRQLGDYTAIVLVTPLCLMAAAALTTASQLLDLVKAAEQTLGVSGVLDRLVGAVGPLVALFMGLFFLYKVMPHTRVRLLSAGLGALVGALLWYLVLIAHVRFQIGVARFNALYASFGAIPIFLAWLHLSWLVVLVGAQVAATHQNNRSLAERTRMASADSATKESQCLAAVLCIARAFSDGQPPQTLSALGAQLELPDPLLGELLELLVRHHLLVRSALGDTPAFTLGRPAEDIRLTDLLAALRGSRESVQDTQVQPTCAETRARQLLGELDRVAEQAPANRSLRQLLESAE